ncbi:MAG: hypothetical protein NTW49_00650 [Bacteroidia bacterium]|nr:hypothetical protein [Bacteroidia bacterium]
MKNYETLLQMAICIILLIYCYFKFFYRRSNGFMQFVKYILLPLTVIGGWTIYFIGYHFGSQGGTSLHNIVTHALEAVFSAGRLFVLGNDLIEVPSSMKDNPVYLLWFSLVGSSAVFISVSILINLFGKRLITRVKIWLNNSEENHIFFGVNEASIALANDLLKTNASSLVIFIKKIDKNEDTTLYHAVEETGALIINRESVIESLKLEKEEGILHVKKEFSSPENLKKLRLIRKVIRCKSHMYFLSSNEEWNMNMARSVLDETEILTFHQPLTFHIRTDGADLEEILYESLPAPTANLHIKLFNQSGIAASQLVARYNPADWIAKDTAKGVATSDFSVMIIGFDQTGNAVLRKLIEYGQFTGSQFRAVITDQFMQEKKGRFEHNYPGLVSNYSLDFEETKVGSTGFFELVSQHTDELDYIVVTLGNDALNVRTAVDLQQFITRRTNRKVKIIVRVSNNENYRHLSSPSQTVKIDVFGRTCDIFTEDIVVRGKLEAMATRIHDYYNSQKPASMHRSWDELTRIEQATNTSAADHIYIKLTLCGLTIEDVRKMEDEMQFEQFLGNERFDNLAKGEHLHWNAVLFTNGWDKWDLAKIPVGSSIHKENTLKLHACLVNWEDLQIVGKRFGENYWLHDYNTIRNIYKLIKEGIYL